ncbi:hypothetical protein N0V82_003429 [Gnomoniopsis sp. IMI 355080]|nr:hypothetical protein N0V82_003429 [Gnomoniopsis sp. IMI 355080]
MDALVMHFFSDTGALFPFVHGPSFMEAYELVKMNSFRKSRRSWLGLLNAILAMATVTSASWNVTATDRAAKAEVFYKRAKALCLDQMLHNASLETDGGVLPVASSILQIEHQLLEWQANLSPLSSLVTPDELRNDGDFTMERRFRLILTLRYHNIRILAHRRMLDLYLASIERGQSYDGEDSMLKQVGQRSKGTCFQSASELISIVNILEHSPEPKRGLLGAWWFTLYYSECSSQGMLRRGAN